MEILYETRKSMKIDFSGRSSDFITPKFSRNCQANCEYCYMRRHTPYGELKFASNIKDILKAIEKHDPNLDPRYKKPNQTHPIYTTYDIGCLSDFSQDARFIDWKTIFQYAVDSSKDMFTFASKFFNKDLLKFNPMGKVRIRMSLNTKAVEKLEHGTNSMNLRLKALEQFFKAGYSVHINISPICVYKGWLNDYRNLMISILESTSKEFRKQCGMEYIFLTNSQVQMENASNYGKKLMSYSSEIKNNKGVMRYPLEKKKKFVNQFKQLHNDILGIPIRYIF